MKQLITGTTAYATFSNDAASGRLSHAYMLVMDDSKNLRSVLKVFALRFFGLDGEEIDARRLLNESLTDCRIFPEEGKKLSAEVVSALIEDSALRPVERDKKLYIISGFEQATALVQNKLLKTLEEPPEGVYFLLGATSLSPVLGTVRSRVKSLTIPPFSESEIFSALEREGKNPLNAAVAKSCGGSLGVAENMVGGGWFSGVVAAAQEISATNKLSRIGEVAAKYGDFAHKEELLSQLKLIYHTALCEKVQGEVRGEKVQGGRLSPCARLWQTPALIFASECVDKACADVKFNANFQGLLYDLMLRVIEENEKWLKLQA